jgi:hypothetical protein
MACDWNLPVMSLLNHLQKDGLRLLAVNDGCEKWFHVDDRLSILMQRLFAAEVITSVDESHLVVSDGSATATLFIVLGNEPEELVADIASKSDSLMDRIDGAVSLFSGLWEGKPCPTV